MITYQIDVNMCLDNIKHFKILNRMIFNEHISLENFIGILKR